jgi:hypothetical protein
MKKIYIFSVLLILVFLFSMWLKGQLKIDSCLDLGGRWDYEKKECERE